MESGQEEMEAIESNVRGGLGCHDRRLWLISRRLGFKFKQKLARHNHGCGWSKWKESEVHWGWRG